MAGYNSVGVGVTSVSLPVVNSYVSKTCDKGVKGRRMLLCRVELCVTEMSASRQILMIYIKTVAPCKVSRLGGPRDFVSEELES